MASQMLTKERPVWGCVAEETITLNRLSLQLIKIVVEKGWVVNSTTIARQETPPDGIRISKTMLPDGMTPTKISVNLPNMDYLELFLGHIPANCPDVICPAMRYYAPYAIVGQGIYIWLEPIFPTIIKYIGEDWQNDAPKFYTWVVESDNKGFRNSDKLEDVGNSTEVMDQAILSIEDTLEQHIMNLAGILR